MMLPAGSLDVELLRPKHVELIGIINKPLLLHLVGCLYYLLRRSSGVSSPHQNISLNTFENTFRSTAPTFARPPSFKFVSTGNVDT